MTHDESEPTDAAPDRGPDRHGHGAPPEVRAAAAERRAARARRDWPEADRLRAEIEAAGWKVIDHGVGFELRPAHPPTSVDGGRTRYGHAGAVPSRLDEPPAGVATVVLVATDWPDDLARALSALAGAAPDGTHVVIVAEDPSPEQAGSLAMVDELAPGAPGVRTEVVWLSSRVGHADALNAGIRRALAPVVVVLDTSVEPRGDLVTPLVAALADSSVAVAGAFGVVSGDLRHFADAPAGEVDAVEGYCLAFRRADFAARGPLDAHFRSDRNLDLWWSLVLRDEGEDARPRRAVALDLPLVRHAHRARLGVAEEERDRLSRRNFYRIIDRFGGRRDLLLEPGRRVDAARPGR